MMKPYVYFPLLIFFYYSCGNNKIRDESVTSKMITANDLDSNTQVVLKNRPAKMDSSIYKRIQYYLSAPEPSFDIYDAQSLYSSRLTQIDSLDCELTYLNDQEFFNIDFIESIEFSSNQTQFRDGRLFCLEEIKKSSKAKSYLTYKRTEGGHTADVVSYVTVLTLKKTIFSLPLYYYTAIDGLEMEISSQIEDDEIHRTIITKFGARSENQPRIELKQQFKILESGEFQLLKSEKTVFNCEKYIR